MSNKQNDEIAEQMLDEAWSQLDVLINDMYEHPGDWKPHDVKPDFINMILDLIKDTSKVWVLDERYIHEDNLKAKVEAL